MATKKIHLGMIGLSANHSAWATMTHAAPLKGEPLNKYYDITAISTSSPETARAAAKAHGVSETKAYSSAQDIANDRDVDMLVVSVKVPMHHQLTMPALRAKKDVFVEWPLGANLAQAEEMTALAKEQGVKTVVGLQARQQGVFLKVKEIIDSGEIGRVVSTTVVASSSALHVVPAKTAYFNVPDSGANLVSIPVAHNLDPVLFALGSEFAHLTADLNINSPDALFQSGDGKSVQSVKRNGPDYVNVSGQLKSGTSLSMVTYLTSLATPDHLSWLIAGEKASLKIESDHSQLQMAPSAVLSMYKPPEGSKKNMYANPAPPHWEPIEFPKSSYFGGVAEVYLAFAEGKTEALVDFEEATKRHRMVDAIFRSAKNGTRETYQS